MKSGLKMINFLSLINLNMHIIADVQDFYSFYTMREKQDLTCLAV
jgi:hypothetical protein